MDSQALTSRKGVQQLTGRLAALGQFISRFTDRLKPYLTEPPIMASLETGETLYLYIVVSDVSVSATLFKENEHRKQRPIFFISKSLSEAET